MYRAIMLLVLPGFALGTEAPSWKKDYAEASKEAAAEEKPLAVIFGTGKRGWQQMASDGIKPTALSLLAEKYTPVYVNVGSLTGKRLARTFEMPNGTGIVISDRTGKLQAFRHSGDLTNSVLVKYLRRYADPNRVVLKTDTNPNRPRRQVFVSAPVQACSS